MRVCERAREAYRGQVRGEAEPPGEVRRRRALRLRLRVEIQPSGGRYQLVREIDRARSRLYRTHVLQVNMRLKALAEIYTMHSFAQLRNLIFLSKICQQFQIC